MPKSARQARKKTASPGGEIARRFGIIRLLSLDVDGVLTDGGLYYADDGTVSRKFNVRDGVGIKRMLALGIEVAIVSAGSTQSIHHRARTLGVRHVMSGVVDKLAAVKKLCGNLGCGLAETAHVGDDLNDLPLLRSVGLPLSVADAVPEVRAAARYVSDRRGGDGAVREICDLLAASRDRKNAKGRAGHGAPGDG